VVVQEGTAGRPWPVDATNARPVMGPTREVGVVTSGIVWGVRQVVARRVVASHVGTWPYDVPIGCPSCPRDPMGVCPDLRKALGVLMRGPKPPTGHPSENIPVA